MHIDAWWFNNTQNESDILQPDWVTPKTHIGLYAECEPITLPVHISITAASYGDTLYENQFTFTETSQSNENYEITIGLRNNIIIGKFLTDTLPALPTNITVSIQYAGKTYSKNITCEYATLSGVITDFSGNPFPAPLMLYRISFDGKIPCMAVWSDKNGAYSVVVPKGVYNAFYVDDNSYGKTSLESWGWHMIVDKDEKHNFKIGNGEVYSLNAWANNGGSSTLFIFFRPMILPSIKSDEYTVEINDIAFEIQDISPELALNNVTTTLNGFTLKNISLQKIYETGANGHGMPAYILQTTRLPEDKEYSVLGKQTLIVEYNAKTTNYTAQSQGRTQFFYTDVTAVSIKQGG